ncbi:hypothetical protein [Streptomyces sp. Tue6028]|uniref:hypothetical protein n=1 Tax=Streptomyces sp. Tue6028 TaxID=2036037 RepID=UPI003EBBE05A
MAVVSSFLDLSWRVSGLGTSGGCGIHQGAHLGRLWIASSEHEILVRIRDMKMPPGNIRRHRNHLLIVPVTSRLSFCFDVPASIPASSSYSDEKDR